MNDLAKAALAAILLRGLAQFALELLNRRHVEALAGGVPESFRGTMDAPTYARSVAYTVAKSRLAMVETVWGLAVLVGVLFSGLLPWAWGAWSAGAGDGVWAQAGGLFLAGTILALPSLPLEWWAQFRLEERFGFNTTTFRTWCVDRLKGFALGAALGVPVLALLLKLVSWTGTFWWFWGWVALLVFQLVLLVVAPVLIMPLFNKFAPLPEGTLKERLLELARRTDFRARSIEVMDGSRRSRHANAFFTGLGGFRKIVLFDTLLAQLDERELEAVLAHEIGHFRRRHIPKMMLTSSVLMLGGLAMVGWLAEQSWFFAAFGFATPGVAVALLLFGLLSDTVTFWFSPLNHVLSRRFEYEADAFAARAVGGAGSLISALRKLHEKNLANLTPHPWYSGFYYSHPTLLEREAALRGNTTTAVVPGS